jgi:hypothetical protein
MSLQYVSRVTRREQYLDASPQSPRFAGKLNSTHTVWHHDIGKQEFKLQAHIVHLSVIRRDFPSFIPRPSKARGKEHPNLVTRFNAGRRALGL